LEVHNISSSTAAQLYLSAARYHEHAAAELLNGVDNDELKEKLQFARRELSAAESAINEEEVIARAQSSISYANEIIQVLGEPPEKERQELRELFMLLVAVGAVLIVACGVYTVVKRRRTS
jgi:hypothetical protein